MRSASQPNRPRRSNPAAVRTAQNFYKTSYKQQQEQATSVRTNQAQRPLWSYPKNAYTSQLGFFNTEAHATMGKDGSNPIITRHEQQQRGKFEVEKEDIIDGKLLPRLPIPIPENIEFDECASFAQPSGLTSDGKWLYVADSEGSSIRMVPMDGKGLVKTLVGTADEARGRLFIFGNKDGSAEESSK